MYKLRYKIWLDQDGKAFGQGPYHLLAGIKETGSLSQAARQLNKMCIRDRCFGHLV